MIINKKICPFGQKGNPNKKIDKIEYITIHNTGNTNPTATAKSHADYQYSGASSAASWHYTVDATEIWQSFEDDSQCWHAGDGGGKGNTASIGIEICDNDRSNFVIACDNGAWLTAELLKKYNLTPDKVVQHNHWSGKDCPHEIRSGEWGINWDGFLEKVKNYFTVDTIETHTLISTSIIGKPSATVTQIKQWAKNKNAESFFIDLAETFYDVAIKVGIDPVVAFCQSAKETGYGRFGGVLDASFYNPCGLKITAGGDDYDTSAHKKFDDWEAGIQAQVDHLALYAGVSGYPKNDTPDPRHFSYLFGSAKNVEELGGKWTLSTDYGKGIVMMMQEVKKTGTTLQEDLQNNLEEEIAINRIQILINGKETLVNTILFEDKNYVELRELAIVLGYKVDYYAEKNMPILTKYN